MSCVFLVANITMLILNSDFFDSFDDFLKGFIHGIELSCMICWIIYVVICAVNHETPFAGRKDY
ncbi:MAG: hypothetical protein ACI4KG_07250 [Oscillospiraceae bacterium]